VAPASARSDIIKILMTPRGASSPANHRERDSSGRTTEEHRIARLQQRFPEEDLRILDVAVALGRASVSVDRLLAERIKADGLTPVALQAMISVYLSDNGPLDFATVSDELRVTKANVSWVLNSLEQQGLIVRRPDPRDKRKIRARVTPKGRRMLQRLVPRARDCFEDAFAALSSDERDRLKQLVERVA
jgi:DNA-binding MarR family transcriptional regulator